MTWLPFDLHPEYPPEGIPREELVRRYGAGMTDHVRSMFERGGLAYNPHPDIIPNTQLALRLTELARDRDLHRRFHDRVMDAYWAESLDIGDERILRALADEVGIDGADEVFNGDGYAARVAASTAQAQSIGIHGIPAFLLDRKLLVLGAQPRDVFENAFAQLAAG